MTLNDDTICAVATRPGGALGIVRVSGPEAIRLTDSIFRAASGHPLASAAPYTLSYGQIVDTDGSTVDDVLISVFRAPHSFTGQDSTEISCHGSAYILQKVSQLLISKGCRQAEPGEYTQRAFLAGKMDLSQAEAVADLIASTSAASHRLAMNQMKGGFSRELRNLRDQLLKFTSLIELELDFSEEDVEFADRSQLEQLAEQIDQIIGRLADSFSTGDAIRNGVPVAICGQPNAGKSTLLNALTGEKIAIVSKKPQTTRNRIIGILTKGETQYVFMDTPGMLHARNKLGDYMVKTVSTTLRGVDAAILVVDADYLPGEIEKAIIRRFEKDKMPALLAINKIDKSTPQKVAECIKAYAELFDFTAVVPISALNNDGVDIVLQEADKFMHEGEWFFEEDDMTIQPEKQIAAEFIREKILRLTDNEIPHGTAVVIE